jgi:hypothetical protein
MPGAGHQSGNAGDGRVSPGIWPVFQAGGIVGPVPAQTCEQTARMRADADVLLAHLIRPSMRYRRDIQPLRAGPPRIVIAVGTTSKGQLANCAAVALAGQLGTPVVDFPGGHGGFAASRSSSAAYWIESSPKRPDPADPLPRSSR